MLRCYRERARWDDPVGYRDSPMSKGLAAAWVALVSAAVATRLAAALWAPILRGYDAIGHVSYVFFLDLYRAVPLADQGWSYFHPPLHYALGWLLAQPGRAEVFVRGLSLWGGLASLAVAALSARIVARGLPSYPGLTWLAFASVAFLPVQLYASPMPGNELTATLLGIAAISLHVANASQPGGGSLWRNAGTGGLVGLALLASGAVAWAAARLGGRDLGISGALLSACVPFQALPVAAGVAIFVAVLAGAFGDSTVNRTVGRGWIPGAVGAALVWLSLAPWGNLELTSQFPSAGGWVVLAVTVAVVVSGLLPAGAAGVVWMAVAWTVGSAVAPTPDRGGLEVTDGSAGVLLPAGTGALYILDVRLDGDRDLAVGTPVAVVTVNGSSRALFYPDHATHRSGALQTNNLAVWRPERVGSSEDELERGEPLRLWLEPGESTRGVVSAHFQPEAIVIDRLYECLDFDRTNNACELGQSQARSTPAPSGTGTTRR